MKIIGNIEKLWALYIIYVNEIIYFATLCKDILWEFWFIEDKFIDFEINSKIVDFGIGKIKSRKFVGTIIYL